MCYRFYNLSMVIQYSYIYIIFKMGHFLVVLDLYNTAVDNSATSIICTSQKSNGLKNVFKYLYINSLFFISPFLSSGGVLVSPLPNTKYQSYSYFR